MFWKKRRIIQIFADKSNIGDWISALSIQELLKERSSLNFSEYLLANFSVMDSTIKILNTLSKHDIVIIGGGGLLHPYFAPLWKSLHKMHFKFQLHIWGIGICQQRDLLANHISGELIKEVVDRSVSFSFRDSATVSFIGLSDDFVIGCPSMSYSLLNTSKLETDENEDVLLHVMHPELAGANNEIWIKSMGIMADSLGMRYCQIDNIVPVNSKKELTEMLELYERSKWIISSRLHGCILGATFNKKIIAISNDNKINAFMRDAGKSEWCFDISDFKEVQNKIYTLSKQASWLPYIRKEQEKQRNHADLIINSINK